MNRSPIAQGIAERGISFGLLSPLGSDRYDGVGTNCATIQAGDGPYRLPFMKFTLTYDGELRSKSDLRRKWEIRKHLHPQLKELWNVHPALHVLRLRRYIPSGGYSIIESHHRGDTPENIQHNSIRSGPHIDLCEPIIKRDHTFLPLVRDLLALQCGLKIIFLRKESPGKIYQGGDLDNRLKTLFDALSIPNEDQVVARDEFDSPIYCLLEDDRLITSLSVETHRLLSQPTASNHEVRLLIEVDVRVTNSRLYNQSFLGD